MNINSLRILLQDLGAYTSATATHNQCTIIAQTDAIPNIQLRVIKHSEYVLCECLCIQFLCMREANKSLMDCTFINIAQDNGKLLTFAYVFAFIRNKSVVTNFLHFCNNFREYPLGHCCY